MDVIGRNAMVFMVVVCTYVFAQRQVYPPWPPQSQAGTWEFKTDENNRVLITRFYPYDVVDSWLSFYPGTDSSIPKSGTVRFSNGHIREMTVGELNYYWNYAGAKYAYESYRKK